MIVNLSLKRNAAARRWETAIRYGRDKKGLRKRCCTHCLATVRGSHPLSPLAHHDALTSLHHHHHHPSSSFEGRWRRPGPAGRVGGPPARGGELGTASAEERDYGSRWTEWMRKWSDSLDTVRQFHYVGDLALQHRVADVDYVNRGPRRL